MEAKDYLKLPYHRMFVYDSESDTFTGFIYEFPGCITQGNTIQEAHDLLNEAMESWIDAALELGQVIPEPQEKIK